MLPFNFAFLITITQIASEHAIRNMISAKLCRRLQMIQMSLPLLASKDATTISTGASEMKPERVNLALGRIGVEQLP